MSAFLYRTLPIFYFLFTLSPPPTGLLFMSSFNARFKNKLGLTKRNSSASFQSPDLAQTTSRTPPPPQGAASHSSISIPPVQQIQSPDQASSIASPPTNSSQQSLPQMNHPGQGQRPPSYSAGYPGGSRPSFSRTLNINTPDPLSLLTCLTCPPSASYESRNFSNPEDSDRVLIAPIAA